MSNPSSAVYHCPSCGALAKMDEEAEAGDQAVCDKCGHEFKRPIRVAPRHAGPRAEGLGKFVQRDVVSRRRLVERDQSVVMAELPPPPPVMADKIVPERGERPGEEVVLDDGRKKVIRRRKRKRRTNRRPYVYGALWLLVVVLAFVHLKNRFKQSMATTGTAQTEEQIAEKAREAEVLAYLNEHMGECQRVLGDFLQAADVSERAQFVYKPLRVTPHMSRFIADHGIRRPTGQLTGIKNGLIVRENYRAIETLWRAEDDEEIEVVFIRADGAWRIDWEAFACYSTTPWHFYVRGGVVAKEGEFRLFMREVQLTEQGADGRIGLKFYAPEYDVTKRHRTESPTVLVAAASPLGQRVRAVLDHENREDGWGDPRMHKRDPKGLLRVRVALEWKESASGSNHLHLKDLLAGNWLATGLDELIESKEEEKSDEAEAG